LFPTKVRQKRGCFFLRDEKDMESDTKDTESDKRILVIVTLPNY